jgi:hypothetical protein
VQIRLHDAYVFRGNALAQEGSWCQAGTQYANAVDVLPLESTVDTRDEARIRCQATASPPPATPTARATTAAQATATPGGQATAEPTALAQNVGSGRIVFTGYDKARERHDVYEVDLAQGNAQLLRGNANQPAMSPGGRFLAFRNLDPEHLGLSILDFRSDTVSEMTAHGEDSTPSWSADGQQIIFASNKHGDRKWRLYAISPGEVRGEGEEWGLGRMPAWSADGSRIAYQGCDTRGDNCAIWVMQPGGFNPAQLTTDASDTAPAWSPDGKRLAFLSDRQGAWAIYVLELQSGSIQRLIATGDPYPEPLSERLSWGW